MTHSNPQKNDRPVATVEQIVKLIDGQLVGTLSSDHSLDSQSLIRQRLIHDGQSIDRVGPQEITFAENVANFKKLAGSQAAAVIIPHSLVDSIPQICSNSGNSDSENSDSGNSDSPVFIAVENAQKQFLRVLAFFRPPRERKNTGISPKADISPSANIGKNTNIAPFAVISDDVTIGDNCDIHSGVFIGPGSSLGNNVTLYANVVIYHDIIIHNNVIIHAAAVIGADGFGYRMVNGRHERLPHFGTVEIGHDVEIGACSTIDRAMIGKTSIGDGTKIDNLVIIAHNCEIGQHNIFVSGAGVAGSATTGDYVVCAGQAGIADHVHVGHQAVIASKAGVHKDVPDGATYAGAPAYDAVESMKSLIALRKLPAVRKTVRQLETQVAELSQQIAALSNNSSKNDSKNDAA